MSKLYILCLKHNNVLLMLLLQSFKYQILENVVRKIYHSLNNVVMISFTSPVSSRLNIKYLKILSGEHIISVYHSLNNVMNVTSPVV